MIGVKKIAHATYETPDLDQQVEYYTDILGLNLIAKEKDAAYLASTIDHHSVVLRQGGHSRCVRLGFQLGPDDDLGAFEKQTAAHGIKTQRKNDPEPSIAEMVSFEDPKGTVMEVFKRGEFVAPEISNQGHRAAQARPRRVLRQRRQEDHRLLLRRAGLPRVRLDGRLLLVPALRRRSPHHQPDADPGRPALPHRVRAARLGPHADRLRPSQPQRLQAVVGSRPPRHRPQSVRLSSRAERADHRAVRATRPDERGARLFRAAALAPRPAAEAEGLGRRTRTRRTIGVSCRPTRCTNRWRHAR